MQRPVTPVRREIVQPTPAEAYQELTSHLTARGFTHRWVRHLAIGEQKQQIEYWSAGPLENVMLMLTKEGDQITDFKAFLDSQMCPPEALP